jgi:hypothetical protein
MKARVNHLRDFEGWVKSVLDHPEADSPSDSKDPPRTAQ